MSHCATVEGLYQAHHSWLNSWLRGRLSCPHSADAHRVASGVKPEKARAWELGTRYDDGTLRAEIGAFLINFDNQYDSHQTNDTVIPRDETRHQGIESSINYALDGIDPALAGFNVYTTYAYVDASMREDGPNKGNRLPFSSKHKGTLGGSYTVGPWTLNLDSSYPSSQFADNANTSTHSADGSNGASPATGCSAPAPATTSAHGCQTSTSRWGSRTPSTSSTSPAPSTTTKANTWVSRAPSTYGRPWPSDASRRS